MDRYFYHPDHLGSSSWITDNTGRPIQHLHYLPFGEDWVDQRNSSWNAPYTFSGKEKDVETGYGYFGARYYDSGLSIWLSVDPMSDKYPSMSPYNYCANNPVFLVDPDGREFSIAGIIYVPGGNCPDEIKDAKDKAIWNTMNKLYSTDIGKTVIDEMNVKGYTFKISDKTVRKDADGSYSSNKKNNGGTINLNGNVTSVLILAHEVFHGYQDLKGQGGSSIPSEVEAYLFQNLVGQRINNNSFDISLEQRKSKNNNYNSAFQQLVVRANSVISSSDFNNSFGFLVTGFKDQSKANTKGTYNRTSEKRNGNINLIKQFYNIK